jgi:peptidoglycan hydrolase CwlO-like protein
VRARQRVPTEQLSTNPLDAATAAAQKHGVKEMTFIYLGLIAISIIIGLIVVFKNDTVSDAAFCGFLLLFLALPPLITPLMIHNYDVTTINNAHKMLQIRQDALDSIDAQLQNFSTQTALMNADAPFSSLAKEKSQFVREISEIKEKVLEAEMRIERRKRGFTAYVTWFF